MRKVVLITEAIHPAGLDILMNRAGLEIVSGDGLSPAEMATAVSRSDAIATRTCKLTSELLSRANRLATVAKHGVGCDNIDVAHCTARGIPVTITAAANKVSVAEQTLMLMLVLAKDAVGYDRAVRAGDWNYRYSLKAFELAGRTLLIIGFGRIGREVAVRARAFGMRVVVVDIAMDLAVARGLGCEVAGDFRSVLPTADIVTLHVPKTPLTSGMIGRAELAAMKPGAVLINCARGGLVEESALAAALTSGHLAAAGLDVFDAEPLSKSHPLAALPNVLLSPHSAGSTAESGRRMAIDTAENILAVFDGRLDRGNVFNPEVLGVG